jgi:lipopolysaccharide transport system ATP-binding protein
MSSSFSIKVEKLSKVYRLTNPRINTAGKLEDEHSALDEVSFTIQAGESVGVFGPNGSGKSTLLRVLAGVTKPTSGKVTVRGKVASVLDIGAGFHPELNGYENIFLNGKIHGFSKKEISQRMDKIIEFSGVEKFISEPVKNYSSGMYLRLAFSILSHLDFDIYLFDEVLSVGDAAFYAKSQKKLRELNAAGKTIVFVSHNLAELENQDTYILLKHGQLIEKTRNRNLLSNYLEDMLEDENTMVHTSAVNLRDFSAFSPSPEVQVSGMRFYQNHAAEFSTNAPFTFEIEFEKRNREEEIDPVLIVSGMAENILLSSGPFLARDAEERITDRKVKYQCEIPSHFFGSQIYRISICFIKNLGSMKNNPATLKLNRKELDEQIGCEVILYWKNVITFKPVLKNNFMNIDISHINLHGSLLPAFNWRNCTHVDGGL